jgi:hypothetical protein
MLYGNLNNHSSFWQKSTTAPTPRSVLSITLVLKIGTWRPTISDKKIGESHYAKFKTFLLLKSIY